MSRDTRLIVQSVLLAINLLCVIMNYSMRNWGLVISGFGMMALCVALIWFETGKP